MSQINDALKRAKEMQPKNTPSGVSPLPPAEPPPGQSGTNWIWPVVILLFLLLFVGLVFAISAGSHAGKKMVAEPAPVPVVPVAVTPPPAPVAPATNVPAAKAPAPARVQGIVFDPVHPYAIVSGKTVHVGDAVNGMQVLAISIDAVTLAGNGQTNQLRVGQH